MQFTFKPDKPKFYNVKSKDVIGREWNEGNQISWGSELITIVTDSEFQICKNPHDWKKNQILVHPVSYNISKYYGRQYIAGFKILYDTCTHHGQVTVI